MNYNTKIFRGRQIKTGEWLIGSLLILPSRLGEKKHYIIEQHFYAEQVDQINISEFEVFPNTVGMQIGYYLSDSSAMFEGDIIDDGTGNLAVIFWDDELKQFLVNYETQAQVPGDWCIYTGNIHDNYL